MHDKGLMRLPLGREASAEEGGCPQGTRRTTPRVVVIQLPDILLARSTFQDRDNFHHGLVAGERVARRQPTAGGSGDGIELFFWGVHEHMNVIDCYMLPVKQETKE